MYGLFHKLIELETCVPFFEEFAAVFGAYGAPFNDLVAFNALMSRIRIHIEMRWVAPRSKLFGKGMRSPGPYAGRRDHPGGSGVGRGGRSVVVGLGVGA